MPGADVVRGARLSYVDTLPQQAATTTRDRARIGTRRLAKQAALGESAATDRRDCYPACARTVTRCDRVVAYMQNRPGETRRSSRAPSIGAVWRAVSPDFGVRT